MSRNRRLWAAGGLALAVVIAVVLLWPRSPAPAVPAATSEDCHRRLVKLRTYIYTYYQQHGRYPRELFDPSKTVGVPEEYRCPVDGRNYSYDPKCWPEQLVICTVPEHRGN